MEEPRTTAPTIERHPEDRHEPHTVPPEVAERVGRVLAGVTYKPGWSFAATAYDGGALYIEAFHTETDSRNGTELPAFARRIPLRWPIYTASTDEGVLAWVRHCIHEWEVHEADEWLRFDGNHVHDPHECTQCRIGGCRA
jgi:hypothetical protein